MKREGEKASFVPSALYVWSWRTGVVERTSVGAEVDPVYHLEAPRLIEVLLTQGPCVACLGSAEYISSVNLYNTANYSQGRPNNTIHQSRERLGGGRWPECKPTNLGMPRVSSSVWLCYLVGVNFAVLLVNVRFVPLSPMFPHKYTRVYLNMKGMLELVLSSNPCLCHNKRCTVYRFLAWTAGNTTASFAR